MLRLQQLPNLTLNTMLLSCCFLKRRFPTSLLYGKVIIYLDVAQKNLKFVGNDALRGSFLYYFETILLNVTNNEQGYSDPTGNKARLSRVR